MKNIKSEKGIALVMVLLIITVFSILGMAVISFIISNTKQVEKTEQEMQAVDLAEMGVIYYKNAFILNADEVLRPAINTAIEDIEDINKGRTNNNKILINEETIFNQLEVILTQPGKMDQFLPIFTLPFSRPLSDNQSYSFQIINHSIEPFKKEDPQISITFKSRGTVEQHNEDITTTILLNKNNITELIRIYRNNNGGGTGIGNDNIEMDFSKLVEFSKLVGLNSCKYDENTWLENNCSYDTSIDDTNKPSDIKNRIVLINGSLTLQDGNKDIENSTLYITNQATFGNINQGGINGLILFVDEDATFGNTKNGIQNSKLYIKGNADFKNNIGEIGNSTTICVGGNITGGISANGVNVFSWKQNKEAYNRSSCPPIKENNSSGNGFVPIIQEIENQTDENMDLTYH